MCMVENVAIRLEGSGRTGGRGVDHRLLQILASSESWKNRTDPAARYYRSSASGSSADSIMGQCRSSGCCDPPVFMSSRESCIRFDGGVGHRNCTRYVAQTYRKTREHRFSFAQAGPRYRTVGTRMKGAPSEHERIEVPETTYAVAILRIENAGQTH